MSACVSQRGLKNAMARVLTSPPLCVQFSLLVQARAMSLVQTAPYGDAGQGSSFGDGESFDSSIGENTPDEELYPYN